MGKWNVPTSCRSFKPGDDVPNAFDGGPTGVTVLFALQSRANREGEQQSRFYLKQAQLERGKMGGVVSPVSSTTIQIPSFSFFRLAYYQTARCILRHKRIITLLAGPARSHRVISFSSTVVFVRQYVGG